MNVYEETFGTDWEDLTRDEVVRRAFALGVAEALDGEPPQGEFERLCGQVRGRYGRSLVELAYDEGRTKGDRPASGRQPDEVWTELVESEDDAAPVTGRSTRGPDRPTDLPESISVPSLLGREKDELAKLGLPEFLR